MGGRKEGGNKQTVVDWRKEGGWKQTSSGGWEEGRRVGSFSFLTVEALVVHTDLKATCISKGLYEGGSSQRRGEGYRVEKFDILSKAAYVTYER